MRQIPELDFRDDRSMEHAEEIARAISEIHRQPNHVRTVQEGDVS
jgi:ribosome-binding factor A